jgi:DNA-binding transcriptional LysR family regulator
MSTRRSPFWPVKPRERCSFNAAGIEFREVFSSESVTGISAAVAAGVAVALIGEESLRDDFLLLAEEQGFPPMPESSLVLQVREGADNSLVQAMCGVIENAFS